MNLLPNEAAMFKGHNDPRMEGLSDEDLSEQYQRGEVRIVTEQARYPLSTIKDMVESKDYELNPEFQRRHRWDVARKSRLIESLIINVPIPPIFLYEARYSFYEVMDGLQRLTTIRDFYSNDFRLEGLQEWSSLNGRTYDELPENIRRGIDRRYLSSVILLHETAKTDVEAQRLKQLVFERINSGGERLTHQESRNAIYGGPFNNLLLELSRHKSFCAMWSIPAPSDYEETTGNPAAGDPILSNKHYKKMEDAELVLRFFAYRQQLEHQGSRALRDYWDEYQRIANTLPTETLNEFAQQFKNTSDLVYKIFDDAAFYLPRKTTNGGWVYAVRPTTTVYDPLMYCVSKNLSESEILLERADAFKAAIHAMHIKHDGVFSGRTANATDIRKRNKIIAEVISKVLADTPIDDVDPPVFVTDDEEDQLSLNFDLDQ